MTPRFDENDEMIGRSEDSDYREAMIAADREHAEDMFWARKIDDVQDGEVEF